jgi:hypothetical protein
MSELRELLREWIAAEVKVIGEYSGDMIGDYRSLIARAKARAARLALPWDDDEFIPDYVQDCLRWEDEE